MATTTQEKTFTISRTLNEAADLIEKNGMCKASRFESIDGSFLYEDCGTEAMHCAVGAIDHVMVGCCRNDLSSHDPYGSLPVLFVERETGKSLPMWNDAPRRSQKQVVDLLRKVARIAAKKEAKLLTGEELVL